MVEIITGIISGIVSGMGMGGGTILIMVLTCMLGVDQKIAQASNLIYFIPTAVISTIINTKNQQIKYKIAIPIMILGSIGAILGAKIATNLNTIVLRKLFGIFILCIAMYESYSWYKKYIKRNNSTRNKKSDIYN